MWRDLSFGRRIWTKALKIGLKQLFEGQEAASSAIGLQSAGILLCPVPEMQLMSYFSNIPQLARPGGSKEAR